MGMAKRLIQIEAKENGKRPVEDSAENDSFPKKITEQAIQDHKNTDSYKFIKGKAYGNTAKNVMQIMKKRKKK